MLDEKAFNQGIADCRMPKRKNPVWREWCLPDYNNIPVGFELDRKNQEHIALATS